MKPTKGWIAAILLIPILVAILLCVVFGIILFIVSLGHVDLFKYIEVIGNWWGRLMTEKSDELKRGN
jgi:uncharacterized membrane protein